jgi:3-isopropylmalate/(R)-2-methylmalate dehydratase large subunit
MGLTLFEKIWQKHLVCPETDQAPAVIYIDLHLLHEVTTPQAFEHLELRGLTVRHPERCLATLDHATPTLPPDSEGTRPYVSQQAARQVDTLRRNCRKHAIELHDWDSPHRGIVHVIGPELGATRPGMTIVCGDSHTSTHGAFGALAFGIGTTEVSHVLASQCMLQRKPRTMYIEVEGNLRPGVSAKDVILSIIGQIGVDGASGCVIEYGGSAIRHMDMEARMTLCNMSIECGARAGMIAPDEITFNYLQGRPRSPEGELWSSQVREWRQLFTDSDATFDRSISIQAGEIRPTISFGTNPGMVVTLTENVPKEDSGGPSSRALEYMGFSAGESLLDKVIDMVFIGSCTNARITDLRIVGSILEGRKVATGTRLIIVPGSEAVKREAEQEGLDDIFINAGAEWRNPGCSMCIAMNGDMAAPGQYVVSTSNRNFEGRQGAGARTLLASPLTAAVIAVTGVITDPDSFLEQNHG